MVSDQLHEFGEPCDIRADAGPGYGPAVLVHEGDIVMGLGPVDPASDRHPSPPSIRRCGALSSGGDLMEALNGAASHKPCTTQLARRVTVYVQTSVESVKPRK